MLEGKEKTKIVWYDKNDRWKMIIIFARIKKLRFSE